MCTGRRAGSAASSRKAGGRQGAVCRLPGRRAGARNLIAGPAAEAMAGDELGSLRRTRYSADVSAGADGERAVVMGWVASVRGHGAISFMTVRDRDGDVQVVAKAGSCPDGVRERIAGLKVHSSVAVSGTVRASPRSPSGAEVVPDEIRVFSEAARTPPFEPAAVTVKNIDTRLEARHIDLRRRPLQHVFRARSAVLRAVREHLYGEGFTEVSTPKMISSATEGGAALFSIFYYDRGAFLAQSPQLYKEQLTMSFEKVFEIAPIFRAEPSRTARHLSEAISIDVEEAFVDYADAMDGAERVVGAARGAAARYAGANAGSGLAVPEMPAGGIPRRAYGDVVDAARDAGAGVEWGDDLHPSALRKAGLEGFYFIKDWPAGPKPFYVKPGGPGGPRASESFDLMFGDLEISSGSTRISGRAELEERMRNKGMDVGDFAHHLGAFDYGVPPHAGFGIGLERLMMALTGTANIRDASFYPRDADRLAP